MRPATSIAALSLVAGLLAAAVPTLAAVELEEPVKLSGAGEVPGAAGIAQHRLASALDGYAVAAWLEAVPGAGYQLMARTREPGGEWSPIVQVSSSTTGVGTASLDWTRTVFTLNVSAAGDAALAWRQQDTFDNDPEIMVFAATLARGESAWQRARVGGQEHGVSIFHTPSVAVLPGGDAAVGWTGNTDEEKNQVQVYATVGGAGGWETPTQISDMGGVPLLCTEGETGCRRGDVDSLILAADGAGELQARMTGEAKVSNGSGGTTTRQWILTNSRPVGGAWSFATPITSVQDPYVAPSPRLVVGDRTGPGFVTGWSVPPVTEDGPGGVHVEHAGAERTYRHATASYGLGSLTLVGGRAAAMLSHTISGVTHYGVIGHEPGADDWSDPSDPASQEHLEQPTAQMGLHPDGRVTVIWAVGIPRKVYVTQRPAGSSSWDDPRRVYVSTSSQALPILGAGADGTGTVLWRESVDGVTAVLAAGFAPEVVDTPPTVTMTAPTKLLTRDSAWTVAWQVTDEGAGVDHVEIGTSETEWDEAAATTATTQDHAPDETSFGVMSGSLADGTTSCYAGRGFAPGADVAGEWSEERCVVTPVDDRTLTRVGTWARKTGDGRWNETYLQTKTKGARLKLAGVHASVIGLLVEKGPGFGKVKVVFDGMSLGTVDLAGAAKKRVAILLEDFPTSREGTIVLKVVSGTGKVVRVDGVYAGQPSDAAFSD